MKISKYLGTFALLAMLAACSTEDEQVRFAGDEVKVNATIGGESVFTRSNPIGSTEEQSEFQDFDQIGISVNGGAAHKYEMSLGSSRIRSSNEMGIRSYRFQGVLSVFL